MNLTAYKVLFSIFILWLFSICGMIGIKYSDSSDWFLASTPLNLIITFLVLFLNIKKVNFKVIIALIIPFLIGFLVEALGVNYGLFFGNYAYGENLGYKVFGVPLTICINWTILTVVTFDLSFTIFKNRYVAAFLGGFLMMLLDIIIEISAPKFDFWEFENTIVPIKNYIAWWIIGTIASLIYQTFKVETNRDVSIHILASIGVFFGFFLF